MDENEAIKKWEDAKTIDDIGELTALWLEGKAPYIPSYGSSPDEETSEIKKSLALFNRNGFVTTFSQPAEELDEEGNAQRACVDGIATERLAKKLASLTLFSELLVFIYPVGSEYGYHVPVTIGNFRPFTWCGSGADFDHILREFGAPREELTKAISKCWSVIIIDLKWGRNDLLWTAVSNVLEDDYDKRYSSVPYDEGLERDFIF